MAYDPAAIFEAIRDQWVNDVALSAVIAEPWYKIAPPEAPNGLNGIFQIVSDEPVRTLATTPAATVEGERVFFDLVIYDDARALTGILDAHKKMVAAFDGKELTFDGGEYKTISCLRLPTADPFGRDDKGNHRAWASFEGWFHDAA